MEYFYFKNCTCLIKYSTMMLKTFTNSKEQYAEYTRVQDTYALQ